MRKIERIFVHCTAGPQTQTVEEIKKYWKTHNKWTSPGYHYIIKPNGEIVPLQPEDKPSNGVAGYNSTSINVCYIGGVDKQGRAVDNRTWEQKESLIYILKELKTRYPDAKIMGHREIWGTDSKKWKKMCPCFNASEEYEHILDPVEVEEPAPVQEPAEPITEEHEEEVVEPIISGEEDETPITEPQPRPTIIGFIIKLISKLFRK